MDWMSRAACANTDPDFFFDTYEDYPEGRPIVDAICMSCPVQRECLGTGVSRKEWGVWAGVYLEEGQLSEQFNDHKTGQDWAALWETLTMEKNVLH